MNTVHSPMTEKAKAILELVESARVCRAEQPESYLTEAFDRLCDAVELLVLRDGPLWEKEEL